MSLLNLTPLLSTILGFSLTLFILFRRAGLGQNKKIRLVLCVLVLVYALNSLDNYLDINDLAFDVQGFSYLFYHITGYLFFYFISLFAKYEINLKKWIILLIIHSLLRWSLFLPLLEFDNITELINSDEADDLLELFGLEYLISSLINVGLTVYAFYRLNKKPLLLSLDVNQKNHYKWIKIVIILSVLLQIGSFINAVMNTNDFTNLDFYLKLDTLLIAVFYFIFAFSVMHFPVFAFTGNFEDLPEETKQKYVKSSLKDSSDLFNKIQTIVETEALYLEYDLKLNVLAEKLDKSVHHISQAINQNANMSFPDFINNFRIEEAKKKLLEPKPDTIFAISLDVGFNSKAAFYTAFKKFTSQTPTEFKKQNKPT
ncbi:AraC family transcriptional regulator [Winogradskyella sp.]|jgi:AraC-like DNA-binding protein|uniref:helix-turn-helix domain-containing protein n=1 Tax=Winogradskyella sp. TaxID=1883156 RepID=UPI0025D0639D|nr:helix-turn-helix domain-containing protein [Winogradskyella sp.]MCT4631073.1 helix-turn-helix domain-containing protein [Winogradskyella sp.]